MSQAVFFLATIELAKAFGKSEAHLLSQTLTMNILANILVIGESYFW